MKIENYGSFCNIYSSNGGMSFGTIEPSIAREKIKEFGGNPDNYPMFLKKMSEQDKSSPTFILQTNPICMFLFDTEKYPDIKKEVSR